MFREEHFADAGRAVCSQCGGKTRPAGNSHGNSQMIPRQRQLTFRYLVTKGIVGCWPVVSLELRAASRRHRTYWLRMAYMVALTLYVAMVWAAVVSWMDQGAYTRSRMAAAGVEIGSGVVWFLLLAGPTAAVLLATNCFQEELHRGGLTLVFSTPLDYAHIVAGKFIGRLAQMQVLVLAALPPLALVRVFGGVPAVFVAGGVMLAMGCSAVGAAMAMLYSARYDEPHLIVPMAAIMTWLFNAPAWLASNMGANELARGTGESWPIIWIFLAGLQMLLALRVLASCTRRLAVRGGVAMGSMTDEKHRVHNLAGPSGTPEIVAEALSRLAEVRRATAIAAHTLAGGPADNQRGPAGSQAAYDRGPAIAADSIAPRPRPTADLRIPWPLEIKGSPIIWRAMRRSFLFDRNTTRIAIGVIQGYLYFSGGLTGSLASAGFHQFVLALAMVVYIVLLATTSSALISSERQGRCWHVLLTTPLTDWQILWAKIRLAIWKASLPVQISVLHVGIFTAVGVISPLLALHVLMLFAGVTVFVVGLGLLCSCIFKRTTAAMLSCMGCLAGLWVLGPGIADLLDPALRAITGLRFDWAWLSNVVNPFCVLHAAVMGMGSEASRLRAGGYNSYRLGGHEISTEMFTWAVVWLASGLVFIGAGLAWLAKKTFRRGIV